MLWGLELMENEISKLPDELISSKDFVVGNDLVFIPDFTASFNNLFKKKVYTAGEIAYCDQFADSTLRYASTWAAKEAVYKALKQVDPSTLGWKKIEITRDKPVGQPHVIVHNKVNLFNISLTISHDGDYVWAIALVNTNLQSQ
jgi:phosphopantetheine--protein transferase-like protein